MKLEMSMNLFFTYDQGMFKNKKAKGHLKNPFISKLNQRATTKMTMIK